ncbi:MAG: CHRD domain-containing protein, partial [Bryobacteraceae bacterium]|nr:CHRD domain-containing protein [Bryobacteraceae bacterium]
MLSGREQTPPVMTDASGMVVAALRQDGKRLRLWAVFQGVAEVTGAHLHRGSRGSSGPIVADLSGMVQGSVLIADIDASSFADALVRGEIYLNIHTASNPNGELRGQLELSAKSQLAFELWLDGGQQTPPVKTGARG